MAKGKKKKIKTSDKSSSQKNEKHQPSSKGAWINKNLKLITIIIFVLAGLIRLGYVYEIVNGPLGTISTFENSDANFFDQWSKKIIRGDWLGKDPFHPIHDWHRNTANYYFQSKGQVPASNELGVKTKELWNEWYGGSKFHQEPLYPYFNSILYGVSGGSHTIVFFFQIMLSLISLFLLMALAKVYFNEVAAIFAGLIFAFYGPSIFYDGILLRTSAIATITLAIVYFYERTSSSKRSDYALFGIVSGLAFLLKSTLILLFLALVTYKVWSSKPRIDSSKSLIISIVSMLLILSPLMIRNAIVGVPLLSNSSVGAITYINSNFEEYIPSEGFQVNHTHMSRIMEKTEGRLFQTVVESINGFSSFGKFIGLQFKKAKLLFTNHEIPNNFNFYLHKKYSNFLNLGILNYAIILGFGLLGIFFYLRNNGLNGLLICLLVQVAILVGFYIISRFRLPLAVCLIPFAGFALSEIIRCWNFKKVDSLKWASVAAVLIITFSILPPNPKTKLRRSGPSLLFTHYYLPILQTTPTQELHKCVDLLHEILDKGPDHIINYRGADLNFNESNLAKFYAAIYTDLASVHKELNQASNQRKAEQMAARIRSKVGTD